MPKTRSQKATKPVKKTAKATKETESKKNKATESKKTKATKAKKATKASKSKNTKTTRATRATEASKATTANKCKKPKAVQPTSDPAHVALPHAVLDYLTNEDNRCAALDFDRFPERITANGRSIANVDAGCGPHRTRVKTHDRREMCCRKFTEADLNLLCPELEVTKETTLKKVFDHNELKHLQEECKRWHEPALKEASRMDASDWMIYESLKQLVTELPQLISSQVLNKFFQPLDYTVQKITDAGVVVAKAGGSLAKFVPFATFSSLTKAAGVVGNTAISLVDLAAKAGWNVTKKIAGGALSMVKQKGLKAASWVYNSPRAQMFLMSLTKLVKHFICTSIGALKPRESMSWGDVMREMFAHGKHRLYRKFSENSEATAAIVTAGLGFLSAGATGLVSIAVTKVMPAIATYCTFAISGALMTEDVFATFLTGCRQFEHALSTASSAVYFAELSLSKFTVLLLDFLQHVGSTGQSGVEAILSVTPSAGP